MTVTRAFKFAATKAAAKTVVRAANVLNIIRTSMPSPITGRSHSCGNLVRPGRGSGSFLVNVAQRQRVQLVVGQLFLIEVLLQDGCAVTTTQHFCSCDQRSVTRNLIMLNGLRRGD